MKKLLGIGLIVLLLPALLVPAMVTAQGEQGQDTALEALLNNPDVGPSEKAALRALQNMPPLNEHQSDVAIAALQRRFEEFPPEPFAPPEPQSGVPDPGSISALSYSSYPGSHWWEVSIGEDQMLPYTDIGQHGSGKSGVAPGWVGSNHFTGAPGGAEAVAVIGPAGWGSGHAWAQTGQTFYVTGSGAAPCQVYTAIHLDGSLTVFGGASVDLYVWMLIYDYTAGQWTSIELSKQESRSVAGLTSINEGVYDGWTAYLQPGHYYWAGVQISAYSDIYLTGLASCDFGPQDGDGSGYPGTSDRLRWGYFWFDF